VDKICICGAPMRIVTSDRGFVTYSCTRGCNYYLSEEIKADVEYHAGELGVEIITALMRMSGAVFCSAGFALILAQAVSARVVAVFGGHESARFYSHGAKTDFFIEPNEPCECFSKAHSCNKTINIEAYLPRLRSFINGTD